MSAERHPATEHMLRQFSAGHLAEGPIRQASQSCGVLAEVIVDQLPDGIELTVGLRKLLEAKDCFVRAAVMAEQRKVSKDAKPDLQPALVSPAS